MIHFDLKAKLASERIRRPLGVSTPFQGPESHPGQWLRKEAHPCSEIRGFYND